MGYQVLLSHSDEKHDDQPDQAFDTFTPALGRLSGYFALLDDQLSHESGLFCNDFAQIDTGVQIIDANDF